MCNFTLNWYDVSINNITILTVIQRVTASIGIATIIPTADIAPVDLVEAVGHALYQAKANGRNCWFTEGF